MVAEMVLAELAGAVAQIVEERGESGRPGPQVGRAARELRRDHAREEGIAPGRATLLSVVGHHDRAFFRNPVNVGRFPDHHAAVITARLHPADIIAHDEQDIGFLACYARARRRRVLRLGWSDRAEKRSRGYKQRQAVMDYVSFHFGLLLLFWFCVCEGIPELSGDS